MMEIFKWGVSIFLSLCAIAVVFVAITLLMMLSQSYPATFELGVLLVIAAAVLCVLVWVWASLIHAMLFE